MKRESNGCRAEFSFAFKSSGRSSSLELFSAGFVSPSPKTRNLHHRGQRWSLRTKSAFLSRFPRENDLCEKILKKKKLHLHHTLQILWDVIFSRFSALFDISVWYFFTYTMARHLLCRIHVYAIASTIENDFDFKNVVLRNSCVELHEMHSCKSVRLTVRKDETHIVILLYYPVYIFS